MVKRAMRAASSQLGRQIAHGLLGEILGGSPVILSEEESLFAVLNGVAGESPEMFRFRST